MKPKSTFRPFLLAAGSSLLAISSASAASATWNGTTDAVWATGTNWSTTPVPGTGNTATFNNAGGAIDVISLGAGVTVNSLLFDTSNVAAYTIGSGAVGSQTLTLNSGGNITLNDTINANQLINANVAFTGPYTLTNNDTSNTLTIAGIVSGPGGLTKSGVGTVSLTGNNIFTGGITVSTGTLVAAVGTGSVVAFTSIGANAVSIADGSTVQLNNNNTANTLQTIGNVFTGDGLLKVNFAAGGTARNIQLSGLSGFTGTIQLSNSGSNADKWNTNTGLGTINAALIIDSGSQLLSTGTTTTFSKGITVSGTGNSEGYGAIRLNAGTLGGDIALVGNTTIGNEGNTSLTGNIIASGGNYTLTFNLSGNLIHSGNLGGGANTLNVTKGSGTFTLSGSLANFTGTYTQSGGTTNLTGTASTIGGSWTNNGILAVNSTANQSLAGNITGAGSFTKSGIGTLTVSGANAYTGNAGTTVSLGTLRGTQTSGTPFGTGAVALGAGALSLAPTGSGANVAVTGGNAANTNNFTFNADSVFSLNKGTNSSLTYTFRRTNAAAGFVRGANGTLILSVGAIANLGNTVANGGERFLVTAAATPVTTVNTLVSGVVAQDRGNNNAGDFVTYGTTNGFAKAAYTHTNSFTSPGATSNTSVVNITSNTGSGSSRAAYALRVDNSTLTNTDTLTLGGGATGVGQLILNNGTISGGTSLTTPTGIATEMIIYTSGTSVISTPILTATSQAGISVFGPGTLDFSSSAGNTFTGNLRINNSTVIANDNNQLGNSTSQINLVGGTLQTSGTVALGGAGLRAITLAAGQDQTGGTFNVTSGTTTFQNASSGSKILSGAGSLTKTGGGILNLTGNTANTNTGGTFVNGGILLVNNTTGSGTGTGAVTVNDGGTLGGTGIIGGTLTVKSGGIHAPGNSPGIQTISGNTTYESGSIFAWDLNSNAIGTRGTNYDGVTVTGAGSNLTVQSGAIFRVIQNTGADFTDTFWDTNQTWSNIFSVSGTLTGWASNTLVAVYNTTNTLQNVSSYGSFTISGSTLSWSAVPEPSTALAGLLLAAGLLRRRRTC